MCIIFILLSGCQDTTSTNNSISTKSECSPITFHISKLYSNEKVLVTCNNILVFKLEHNNLKYDYNINKKLCIQYKSYAKIRLKISGGDAVPIDTTIVVHKPNSSYHLMVGYSAPKKLKDINKFSSRGYDYKKYPRTVALKPDSVFKNIIGTQ